MLNSGKSGEDSIFEVDDFDDDEDEFDGDEFVDDEDDEGEFVPLRNMKKWLEGKPRGFGEGRDYDTSVEDKLLEELRQSREAQLANINKLKNSPQIASPKNLENKASEVAPSEFRVRLFNLPKKKNINRDLQRAFKGIPGIISIIPAVSGNKKTREPVCKGFAFVYLKSEEYAHRFSQVVSGQSISFGKIEKQIKCEVMSSKAQNYAPERSKDTDFGANNSYSDSEDSISFEEIEDTNENVEHIGLEITNESVLDSISLKEIPKAGVKEKKQKAKQKRPKAPKLNIPGSANRLRVREKAVLTGVISKYAATASALQEQL